MRKKYFDWEYVFEFIWKTADLDGMWDGDDVTVAREFGVTDDEAYAALSALCDRGLIERPYPGKCAIVEWPERDEPADDLQT
jgi:hypothetical protein